MLHFSWQPLLWAALLDLALFGCCLLLCRRLLGSMSRMAAVAVFFPLQFLPLLYLVGLPAQSLVLELDNPEVKAVAIYTMHGASRFDPRNTYHHLTWQQDGRTWALLRFTRLDPETRSFGLQFGPASGHPMEDFNVLSLTIRCDLPWGPLPLFRVRGRDLGELLKSPPLPYNRVMVRREGLHNQVLIARVQSWMILDLGTDSMATLHRHRLVGPTLRLLGLASLLTAFFFLGPMGLPLALDRALGRRRDWRSGLAYGISALWITTVMLLLLLGGAEALLRYWYRDVKSTARGQSYFTLRWQPRINAELTPWHLRGKTFSPRKGDVYRIAVQGDSFTYGQGVYPYTLRFPELLEEAMNREDPPRTFEFLNLGICGQDLRQHLSYLNFVLSLHPDFILYQWYVNDMDITPDFELLRVHPVIKDPHLQKFLIEHSVLYLLVERAIISLRVMQGKRPDYAEYMIRRLGDPESPYARRSSAALERYLDRIQQAGIPCGVVLFPDTHTPQSAYRLGFLHERVIAACQRRGIPYVDLRQAFSRHDGNVRALWANPFDAHPGPLAHEIAAREILQRFAPLWRELAARSLAEDTAKPLTSTVKTGTKAPVPGQVPAAP